jgi:hypothetical protein
VLREARDAGVWLRAEGGSLCLRAAQAPPPELLERLRYHKAERLPALRHPWTDDRSWLRSIAQASDAAAKLEALAAWATAAGGAITGRTVMLPALRPHHERCLAELELRRMGRSLGLEVLEDGP